MKQNNVSLIHQSENANQDLERGLWEKTIELEAINKEFEAFSYAISHDLRAPLRAIDGFTRNILERNNEKLDEEGKADFERVCHAAKRMSEIIDVLLQLSRLTRYAMTWEAVDLSRQARAILEKLQRADSNRNVLVVIQPGLTVYGDVHLLSIALESLLSNAWKFTSKKSEAAIEVGAIEKEEGLLYFIKDNGVGFNMHRADKLFKPFERFHAKEEFPGDGVGLAKVQRIIARHGGRIWAESEPGRGSTFYFKLEKSERN